MLGKTFASLLVVTILLVSLFAPVVSAESGHGHQSGISNSSSIANGSERFGRDRPDGDPKGKLDIDYNLSDGWDVRSMMKQKRDFVINCTNPDFWNTSKHPAPWAMSCDMGIVLTSPLDDTVSNGTITVSGMINDTRAKGVVIVCNGNVKTAPVISGKFSAKVNLTGVSYVVVIPVTSLNSNGFYKSGRLFMNAGDYNWDYGQKDNGNGKGNGKVFGQRGSFKPLPMPLLILLDGDMLSDTYEWKCGFNPLDPDSDSWLTKQNEADNGIIDGYEMLNNGSGEQLPAFVKGRIGADPMKVDTDNDGLTDYFELMKMGLLTDTAKSDTDGDGISDANEDTDNDSLTNGQEQALGTDPLVGDTDGDMLKDGYEVNVLHTNPLLKDSDNDRLDDDSELKVGTDPNNPDSNGNGILDGDETYTTSMANEKLGVDVSITGVGDLSKNLTFSREVSDYYNIPELASPIVNIGMDGRFDSARITMGYDPANVSNPGNLSLAYYNESLGLYVPVASNVDIANHTVSANVAHFSPWVILDAEGLKALYKKISDFNREAYYGEAPGIPAPGDILTVPYDSVVSLTFIESDSAYNNQFGLWSPTKKLLGYGHGTTPGTIYDLGRYSQGTELVFYLTNGVGQTWLSGPASRNPDGVAHAYVKPLGDDTWNLGWEDLYGGGDKDYNDVILNITFARSTTDSDWDGLPDYVETHGIMDNLGHLYYTRPDKGDTDDDGLKDNEEVGLLRTDANEYIKYSFNFKSDPTKKDSDGDGIWDKTELDNGMNPWNMDTDGDSFLDPYDPQPATYNPVKMSHNLLDVIRIIQIGAAYRETGLEGGEYHDIVGDHVVNSHYYTMGCKMPKYVKGWVEKILKIFSYSSGAGGR